MYAAALSRLKLVSAMVLVAIGLTSAGANANAAHLASALHVVSVSSGGALGDNHSYGGTPSLDGRLVVYTSWAANLVTGDTNDATDVFVRDRWTRQTARVSLGDDGAQGNDHSNGGFISPDGRFVFFDSMATNLVPGDTNGHTDVFVRDLTRRTTTRISVSRSGAQGNGESFLTAMSPNGRYVAITSEASNLAPGDTNGVFDSFIYDVWTNSLSRVLPGLGGAEGNDNVEVTDISSDGRFLAFLATATNLVPNDVNERVDAFVYDRLWRRTELVSISTSGEYNDGEGWSPSISGDGRYVAFYGNGSVLSPLVGPFVDHVYVRDRLTRTTTLVSVNVNGDPADGNAQALDVSLDGRYVLISSDAANLVPDDTNGHADAFVYDRLARSLRRISLSESGVEGNEQSWPGKMSADGSIVGVTTRADNLFDSDTNGFDDVLAIDWRRLPN